MYFFCIPRTLLLISDSIISGSSRQSPIFLLQPLFTMASISPLFRELRPKTETPQQIVKWVWRKINARQNVVMSSDIFLK
uniref:Uncharacterized protein n=1 Tax=Rhizophora mucronata TaxID=61149 RepID=A0A2P2J2L1_RHIMU